jgi:hypothetical protein
MRGIQRQGCPFLSQPRMRRNEKDMPEDRIPAAGMGITRNPGVACIWVTRTYERDKAQFGNAGWLFELGEPESVHWFAQGRTATLAEVCPSIESGLPLLEEMARAEGPDAERALTASVWRTLPFLPKEPVLTIKQQDQP